MRKGDNPVKVFAGLHKVHLRLGSFVLRGELSDGRVVEVFCNQHRRDKSEPEFLLAEIVAREPMADQPDSERERQRERTCVPVRMLEGIPFIVGAPIGPDRPEASEEATTRMEPNQ